jgi:hypothetical protein
MRSSLNLARFSQGTLRSFHCLWRSAAFNHQENILNRWIHAYSWSSVSISAYKLDESRLMLPWWPVNIAQQPGPCWLNDIRSQQKWHKSNLLIRKHIALRCRIMIWMYSKRSFPMSNQHHITKGMGAILHKINPLVSKLRSSDLS